MVSQEDSRDAMKPSSPPEFLNAEEREIWAIYEEEKIRTIRKNRDYGSSVFAPPILAPGMSTDSAILVRMSDKIGRLRTLLQPGASVAVKSESIDDSFRDLGSYCFLELIARARARVASSTVSAPMFDMVQEIQRMQRERQEQGKYNANAGGEDGTGGCDSLYSDIDRRTRAGEMERAIKGSLTLHQNVNDVTWGASSGGVR